MATKRPSHLKKIKEQKRLTRAIEKRDARRMHKEAKSSPLDITEIQTEDPSGGEFSALPE
jgi:hypothetical protein